MNSALLDHPPSWPRYLLGAGVILLGLQGLWLSQQFDAFSLVQTGVVSGWKLAFGYLGTAARWALTFAGILAVIMYPRLPGYWAALNEHANVRRTALAGAGQACSFALLWWLTIGIFADGGASAKSALWYISWLAAALLCVGLWVAMWSPPRLWPCFLKREQWPLLSAALIALAVTLFAQATNDLWGPLAHYTFYLSSLGLAALSSGEVAVFEDERILGLNDFWVNIAPVCSGYEGMGLIAAFVALYVWLNRARLRLPHALALFPLGIACIWLLNVVRIIVLVLIGAYWSPEVAVGGFHSFGGWITFLVVSLALLKFAAHSQWLNREPTTEAAAPAPMNLPAATLVPMVVLLMATITTSALAADFDWLYPLRVLAVGAAIAYAWRYLALKSLQGSWLAVGAGLAVAVIWYWLVPADAEYDAAFREALRNVPAGWAALWLALRFVGAVVTVPIAEELAFRGYLLCRASQQPVILAGRLPFHAVGFAASTIAFGALHGHWLAGCAAGAVYTWVRLRSHHIAAPILAHGITNLSLFIVAALTGRWVLI